MRVVGLSLAILAVGALQAMAAPGDQWILGIDHIDNQGAFTTYAGAGYSGVQSSGNASFTGNAYGISGNDGVARVYWDLDGLSVNNGNPVPSSTELYTLEFFGTTEAGHNGFDPVESQFHGAGGETFPIEPSIPWAGEFGTNHEYIAADGTDDGQFHPLGSGPHTPDSASFTAGSNGIYMWLTAGSWLYAKYDFPFAIDRSWSALRLTQVTGAAVPEPASGLLLLLGGVLVIQRRRRAA